MSESFECLNPDFEVDIREKLNRQFFMKNMDFDLDTIELGRVTGSLKIAEKHLQQNYFVHGGVMATAADIVMGFAAYSVMPKGEGVVTMDLQVSYMHPGIGDRLEAEGYVVKAGRSVLFCEANVWVVKDGIRTLTNRSRSTMHRIVL
ncbi:MAG: PaaI family thioesterase [Flavobacteriales bacterium]|nr:PaaI family thioesterase [Bacteroidota bacterium]MCB9239619.1 PaaI family thioesterase [Flavobacteriales bacterium]